MDNESSKTSGTEETPFFDRATHRYCLMAFMNISLVLKMGPAFCRMDSSSWRDKTFDRSSWDLRRERSKVCVEYSWYRIMRRSYHYCQTEVARRGEIHPHKMSYQRSLSNKMKTQWWEEKKPRWHQVPISEMICPSSRVMPQWKYNPQWTTIIVYLYIREFKS